MIYSILIESYNSYHIFFLPEIYKSYIKELKTVKKKTI